MKTKKIIAFMLSISLSCTLTAPITNRSNLASAATSNVTVTVDMKGQRKAISPYIYGLNDCFSDETYDEVTATAIRQGGNRYTGFNWENNFSNAGEDWYNYSDGNLIWGLPEAEQGQPGATALHIARLADKKNIPYIATTLQMAGYVSADDDGEVKDVAPSARWKTVLPKKNVPFSLTPDLTDDYVYMDEYVNYLVKTLGDSTTQTGINGYLLDNEPGLWSGTHPMIHPDNVGAEELVTRSVQLAAAVKAVDPNADIIGPVLYGFGAYTGLQDSPDWENVKGSHDWFVSWYLEKMAQASADTGTRLLDVFDIHYYSEAQGDHRITACSDSNCTSCIEARLQAVRTLWDADYVNKDHSWSGGINGGENSWINQWCWNLLPVIPRIQSDIDKYYPGTKLSLTEYNFGGGNHISGAIAEADALGTFAANGVYLATLWPLDVNDYMFSAINLYTNYDGKGSSFGDTFVPSSTTDIEKCTAYAAVDSDNENSLTLVVSNKSMTDAQYTVINIADADISYTSAKIYGIVDGSSDISLLGTYDITGNSFEVVLPALSVAQIVMINDDNTINNVIGDVNLDSEINTADLILLARFLAGRIELTPAQKANAKCNKKNIDIGGEDLIALIKYLIGDIDNLPI